MHVKDNHTLTLTGADQHGQQPHPGPEVKSRTPRSKSETPSRLVLFTEKLKGGVLRSKPKAKTDVETDGRTRSKMPTPKNFLRQRTDGKQPAGALNRNKIKLE